MEVDQAGEGEFAVVDDRDLRSGPHFPPTPLPPPPLFSILVTPGSSNLGLQPLFRGWIDEPGASFWR